MKRRIYCTIPQEHIKDPILFQLAHQFEVIPNIRGASVTEEIALLTLDLEGEESNITAAVEHLVAQGVQVEDLEN